VALQGGNPVGRSDFSASAAADRVSPIRVRYSLSVSTMNKSYITVGVLAAVILVVGVVSTRGAGVTGGEGATAATLLADKSVLVTYGDNGFTPAVIQIKRGTTVRFLNTSGKALRIAPVNDPSGSGGAQSYEFSSSKSVRQGDSFNVSVAVPGVWAYKNLNAPGAVGVAIVE